MSKSVITISLVAVAVFSQSAWADAFEIQHWHLQNRVGDFLAQRVADSVNITVQNPYVISVTRNHLISSVHAEYDYVWNDLTGQFNVIADLTAQGGQFYAADSFNEIGIKANIDLLLTVTGHFNYQLPAEAGRHAGFSANVIGPGNVIIAEQGFGVDSTAGDPTSGSFNIGYSQVLPPLPGGQRYRIRTSFGLNSDSNGTALGFADGFINFSLTPVPEPASLALLLFGTLAAVRRRSLISSLPQ